MKSNEKISGQALKDLRKEAGLLQRELAAKVGISRETVVAIENEHVGTINSLEVHVLKNWYRVCEKRISQNSRESFVTYLKGFLGLD